MSDEQQAEERARVSERQVLALAREMVRVINLGPAEEREFLREFAVILLRDEVQTADPPAASVAAASATFNPFGIAIPLFLTGVVLVFLFPPVGLVLFAAAAVVAAWGMGTALLARSAGR
jgi:hypothetical protein